MGPWRSTRAWRPVRPVKKVKSREATTAPNARAVARDVLLRVDRDGAYANLALAAALSRTDLSVRDRRFATEIVYGVTRMRRACDFLIARFVTRELDPAVRATLRMGAFQLQFMRVPAHAAVAETVAVAPGRARGLVNAVLRRVSEAPVNWPDDATRLSYPDWVLDRLVSDLGAESARRALEAMNRPGKASVRADGYIQDRSSTWVADLVGCRPHERVLDMCAAPGGKASWMARGGATVVANELHTSRARQLQGNSRRLDAGLLVVNGDGACPPFARACFDRILVDAPCTGLGTLGSRPDARWRIDPPAVDRLVAVQQQLVDRAITLLRQGGTLVYSVCTLTKAESLGIDDHLARTHTGLVPLDGPAEPWRPWGRGSILLPQAAGTQGMALFRYQATGGVRGHEPPGTGSVASSLDTSAVRRS
ncbi:MAG: hypothetical protein EDR02_00895 [Actinobacteria bacterium]|nr:MAG: hypothetical protein EDR02_00895 [Actinomycetota bacterium]RIK05607.1 MAG: hypothetical protein DCC48_10030 [Acidobacteriota bacterium]